MPLLAAAESLASWGPWIIAILQVAIGLGFVIFVHELGHFAVAKWCGVRCDKFMVGFDIGGYKLSHKWGETEYGIGILPLGGYVKMYGQDDNVANIEEEMEKTKALEGSPEAKEVVGPSGKKHWVDRRSYLAKSVPQRMAIISAGVIMNVIFAFIFAWIAYGVGVPEVQCVVGSTTPGGAAWRAGLMPGDRIVQVNDFENPTYKQLQESVLLGNLEQGVTCQIVRATGETDTLTIRPDTDGPIPMIGVLPSNALRLAASDAIVPFSPAGQLPEGEGLVAGDQIVAVDGQEVSTFQELVAHLMAHKSESLTYTVVRGGKAPVSDPFASVGGGERVEVMVGPNPQERLGIVPTLGPLQAVREGSSAEVAGLQPGDQLVAINGIAIGAAPDGEESWDPVTLADRLQQLASEGLEAVLTIEREETTREVTLQPQRVTWHNALVSNNAPWPIESLGFACELRAEVAAIVAGSPASRVDLQAGDRVVAVQFRSKNEQDGVDEEAEPIELGEGQRNWPHILQGIQNRSPQFEVLLTVARGTKQHTVTLQPESVEEAYAFQRGTVMRPLKQLAVATSPGDRIGRAWDETLGALSMVFTFLGKIGGQIPVTALGGPITIAKVAGQSAFEGFGALLMTLTMLSANLAVLNFLPIPVLDGGHMVFLAWEGLTGRPASEKIVIALHMVGFLFLISLMGFVFALDLGFIPRGL